MENNENYFDIDKYQNNLHLWKKYGKTRYYINAGHYSKKAGCYFTNDKKDIQGNIIKNYENGIIVTFNMYNNAVLEEIEKM